MTPTETLHQLDSAGLRHPKTITLAITGACNLACRHCWVEAGEAASPGHVPVRNLRRIIKEFAALGGDGLRLTGGEPLCHPFWLDLMQFSRSLRFRTLALQTNALLFTDEDVTALRDLDFPGLSIQISLDGATAAVHDLVRGSGAFAGTLAGIQKLEQAGLAGRISLFMTEMRHNLEEIPALLEFADSIGIGSFNSGTLVRRGRASEGSIVAPPDSLQYLGLLNRYDSDQRFRELYRKIGTVAAVEWRSDMSVRQECCSFIENPYITPTGRIYPCLLCHTDEFSVGALYEKGLAAALVEGVPLWSSLLRVSQERLESIAECRDCPGRTSCAGGCLGRAWAGSGNLYAADDRCGARRAVYSF
ncbi:MAG TPA: radical SAM protein [Desulfuromonadales bacterium]|nr:radical SAM protein [Desulfuromonadales bacterium]